jgi:hypothetical protein
MVGMGNSLIEYPSTFQTMYLVDGMVPNEESEDIMRASVRARTKDGLELRAAISFQWKLEPEALQGLYKILGGGDKEEALYRDEFVRFARGALVETCALFDAERYFVNRSMITDSMINSLQSAFDQPSKGLKVGIKGLQLREVQLPELFDKEIERTQEQLTLIKQAYAEREEGIIKKDKDLDVMHQTVKQMLKEAEGQVDEILKVNDAEVKQRLVLQEKSAISNAKILDKMDQTDGSDAFGALFQIMQVGALDSHEDKSLNVNM